MGEGHFVLVMAQAAPLFDVRNYGLKDLLQFATFLGTVYGAWKWWRFSKWQIAKRLLEYLDKEEKHITEERDAVLKHIRHARPLEPHLILHPRIQSALNACTREQPREAEQSLREFAHDLASDAKVGTRYMNNANRQAATVLVFAGLVAKRKRSDTDAARTVWQAALQHDLKDAEAIRCLGELDFEAQRDVDALRRFTDSTKFAPDDKLLRAETSQLRAEIFARKRRPLLERNALHDCATNFEALDENARAAKAYERAADVELAPPRKWINQAPATLRKAYHNFHRAGDHDSARGVRERLLGLGVDVSTLPTLDEPAKPLSLPWIRLAAELSILAAAAVLFYLSLQ